MNIHQHSRLIWLTVAIILAILLMWYDWSLGGGISFFRSGTATTTSPAGSVATTTPVVLYQYMEVTESCGAYWDGGDCVNLRSGPGTTFAGVIQLRNGMVLKVASTTITDGRTWYKVGFDGDIRYPERVKNGWWVAGEYVRVFYDRGPVATSSRDTTTSKRIVIDMTTEILSAYDGDSLFMSGPISTGLKLTPTPMGKFWVQRKMPDSYMQGPIPGVSDQYYDLPGVPWDLYFTRDGAAIHGAYWHTKFGEPWSHGCVNLSPDDAKKLYEWADVGVPIVVIRS